MGVDVTKFQYKNLLRMVSKREGNPGPRVILARGFKVLWLKAKFPRKPTRVKRITDVLRHVKTKLTCLVTSKIWTKSRIFHFKHVIRKKGQVLSSHKVNT